MRRYFTIISWMFLAISCRERSTNIASLPSIDLLLPDSLTHINTNEIKGGKFIALLYFSPDCEHCQHETKTILHHIDSLRDVRFYFISNDSLNKIKIFRSVFHLEKYSNITLGWDTQFLFPRHFKGAYPPYLVLYDRRLQQLGTFEGGLEASKMIALVNN